MGCNMNAYSDISVTGEGSIQRRCLCTDDSEEWHGGIRSHGEVRTAAFYAVTGSNGTPLLTVRARRLGDMPSLSQPLCRCCYYR